MRLQTRGVVLVLAKEQEGGMLNLRTLIERYSEVNKDMYLCFIDYEKAFDRVNRAKFIQCLQNIEISGKDIKLIVNLYGGQKAFLELILGYHMKLIYLECQAGLCTVSYSVQSIYR